jgi:prolyl oligopeptidase
MQSALLDMRRYTHMLGGDAWKDEYGDPDIPGDWAYLSKYSPYENLKAGIRYPSVLFTTTTRDERVHPAHVRKMAAKMEALGLSFYYFETFEGGHGYGATAESKATSLALTYTYLWSQLARFTLPP